MVGSRRDIPTSVGWTPPTSMELILFVYIIVWFSGISNPNSFKKIDLNRREILIFCGFCFILFSFFENNRECLYYYIITAVTSSVAIIDQGIRRFNHPFRLNSIHTQLLLSFRMTKPYLFYGTRPQGMKRIIIQQPGSGRLVEQRNNNSHVGIV